MEYIEIIVATIFVNNILLAQFLGQLPVFGDLQEDGNRSGHGHGRHLRPGHGGRDYLDHLRIFLLEPFKLVYLRTIAFILVIASLVQFVEMFLKKSIPGLYAGLGIFLPLITTNCAVIRCLRLNIDKELDFLPALVTSFGYAAGFGLALIIFAGLRERILLARVPKPLARHLHRPDHRRCYFSPSDVDLCLAGVWRV
jgi:electron transport complex protein RnfA